MRPRCPNKVNGYQCDRAEGHPPGECRLGQVMLKDFAKRPDFESELNRALEVLRKIRQWDMINPGEGKPDILADARWLRDLIDSVLPQVKP